MKIRMLGECSISLNGEFLDCFGSAHSKTMKLFILLAYYGAQGLSRQEVLDVLYGDSDHINESGNLRAVSFRVRKQMVQAGLLAEDASISERGVFRWDPVQVSVEIDAKQFEADAHRALEEGKLAAGGEASKREEREKAAEQLREACLLYKGEFLPDMASDLWVAERQVSCQKLFFECLHCYTELLGQLGFYEKILEAIRRVLVLYPYEEWFLEELDALIALERWTDATGAYDRAVKSLMNNMGVHPTEELLKRSRTINERMRGSVRSLMEIRGVLEEKKYEKGAYFCNWQSFVSTYRHEVRRNERNGQSIYLMMCTITEKGRRDYHTADSAVFEKAMEALGEAIRESLRRGDSYTRYGVNQYLILLISLKQEDCPIISGRIEKNFRQRPGMRGYQLNHYLEAVSPRAEDDSVPTLKFGEKNWK